MNFPQPRTPVVSDRPTEVKTSPLNPFAGRIAPKAPALHASNFVLASTPPSSQLSNNDSNPFPERSESPNTITSGEESIEKFYPNSSERVVPIPKTSPQTISNSSSPKISPKSIANATNAGNLRPLSGSDFPSVPEVPLENLYPDSRERVVPIPKVSPQPKSKNVPASSSPLSISPPKSRVNDEMEKELAESRRKIAEFERREKSLLDQQTAREAQLEQERLQLQQQQIQLQRERQEIQQQQQQQQARQPVSVSNDHQLDPFAAPVQQQQQQVQHQQQQLRSQVSDVPKTAAPYSPFDEEDDPFAVVYKPQIAPHSNTSHHQNDTKLT